MKKTFVAITFLLAMSYALFNSLVFAQVAGIEDRFASFDPYSREIVMNMFDDMNIVTGDCLPGIAEGFTPVDDTSSVGVVCGTLSLGNAHSLFTNSWNLYFDTHAAGWTPLAPWDRQNAGESDMIFRTYDYASSTDVYVMGVVYITSGDVIVFVETNSY